jgi:hypothetical protein
MRVIFCRISLPFAGPIMPGIIPSSSFGIPWFIMLLP